MRENIRDFSWMVTPTELRHGAGADYMAARFGMRGAEHPLAERLLQEEATLQEVACLLGHYEARAGVPHDNRRAIGLGISSPVFSEMVTGALAKLVYTAYDLETDHRRIAWLVPVPNFRPVEFPTFDMDDELPKLGENSEANLIRVQTAGGLSAQAESYGARLLITREAIQNDDLGLVSAAALRFASSAARLEARKVYGVLEANSNLADGAPMFHADHGNLLTAEPFSKAALGKAVAALRRQKGANGEEVNTSPAFVVVPPEQELAALEAVASLSNGEAPFAVIAAPWIGEGNWYVMGDPARVPVIGLLRLKDAQRALTVMQEKTTFQASGGTVGIVADLAAAPLSRVGVVKAAA